jgi:asparagine synthase (glutamine-hydrolysing)
MCGFLGEYCFKGYSISAQKNFEELLMLSKHRGPDATIIVNDKEIQLGFNRLAILDLSPLGNQPMKSPSGRYHVVFNGEVYNYINLAKEYSLDNLRSSSDTEVLVNLFDKLGVEKTITKLNGMFAIAVFDKEQDCFYISRDFAGIKPLFYGISENGVVVASQFDQVFKHPWFCDNLHLRPEIMKGYFGFGYMQAPDTIYETIHQVCPGQLLRFERSGDLEIADLIVFKKSQKNHSPKISLAQVLKGVVSNQLVSDVPIATFLSGGIDSPLISAYAKRYQKDIKSFTLAVNNPKLNESEIAKKYAQHLNLEQEIVSVNEDSLLESLDRHWKAYPEPFGDYSSIPTFVICKEAKKNYSVMLSGDGGDELFYGYPRMLDVIKKRWWFFLPFLVRKRLAQLTNKFGITKTWAPYFKTFDAFVTNKHLQIPIEILDVVFKDKPFSKSVLSLYNFKNSNKVSLLNQLRWNEFYAHLQRVLVKVDRASMASSLEVRVPFLDKEGILWAWSHAQLPKHVDDLKKDLKSALALEVPQSLINQKKMGFSVPIDEWLRNYLRSDVETTIFDTPFYGADVINISALHQYVRDFFSSKHSNAWGIWHIYAWQKWWQNHGIHHD